MTVPSRKDEPIAIVGSACRFAGDVNSPSKLWELLKDPKDLQRRIPDTLFNATGFYHPESSYHGHSNVKDAYLTNQDLGVFDADFFGIKPIEAKAIDPQQRFLMEVVYEGLESAGMALNDLKGSDTGVYVGVMFHDYGAMLLRDLQDIPTYYATGTGASILSNRISYFFDWHGPSITVDTACSSSLVAIHMAVQALRTGDAKMAIAAGSNLILGPENFIIESKLKMLSPTGRSRMWDEQADGYARGDGVAALVLKPLSVAIADNDHIECIIRETALNQDGASSGITMPNASAQQELIRSTYTKAGLDLSEPRDRPQFFEAHGTGTPAGDPTEAEAVYRSLAISQRVEEPLYVGSIKTILGHTEGTAGIAAIMKASMALQNATIPPNMLLQQLSSRVAPFYKNIEIPQTAKPWPKTDGPRRSSVNSFGFGGTNAHAILEAYDQPYKPANNPTDDVVFTPFVFSASSEHSLRAMLSSYTEALSTSASDTSPADLAWTLRERRSVLSHRTHFSASSVEELRGKIEARLGEEDGSAVVGVKGLSLQGGGGPKILGIFTGQGAQYPRMGAELIEKSQHAREILHQLEANLAQLPDGPDWSLTSEILAPTSSSRVHDAAISQPLCTAVQILLVNLLRRAGVTLDVVVGHSSGEIAAAYAAGYLTAGDAMRIAYYRGVCLGLSSSPNGQGKSGAMLAVGTSLEDMEELCSDDQFAGRITVAACNSSSSVTASGDKDAILELQRVLDDEGKFNRLLKVDKAYHSRHMLPCYDAYVQSLRRCSIAPQRPEGACAWFSSVQNRQVDLEIELGDIYWAENMTRPVLFHQALQSALAATTCHLAIEVGAHPALQGPARQTIENVVEKGLPYVSLLRRGMDAVEAVSTGLGDLWSFFGKPSVDLGAYESAMAGPREFSVIKGLPKYAWNHKTRYWHESRASRNMRSRRQAVHPLLGDITPDSASHHMSWRNLLRVSEMDWLEGHQVQGQVVFPASGYLASALEASLLVAASTGSSSAIRYIDISDFVVHQPVAFSQHDAGIECLVEMAGITRDQDTVRARFTYSAALQPSSDDLILTASGSVDIFLGDVSQCLLPGRKPDLPHMIDVETDRFYQALSDLGYNFSGRFRSLKTLKRRHLRASCVVKFQPSGHNEAPMAIHPAELDAVLQSCILAYCYPYDEQLRSMHLPTSIQRVRVNPSLLSASATRTQEECLDLVSSIRQRTDGQRDITGDVTLYSSASCAAIQVHGAAYLPLGGADEEQDRRVFSKVHWVRDRPDGLEAALEIPLTDAHRNMVLLLERIATFYLRKFHHEIDPNDPKRSEFPTNWYLNYARYITELVQSGKHKWVKSEWLRDTLDDILEASKPFRGVVDVEIMHLVGKQMPRVFRGETTILEEFRADGSVGILDRYYTEGFGLRESAQWVGRVVKQIADRHPHMNILECGAGTGSATKAIFREIGQSFHSYTYTDISAAFFENASQVFSQQRGRMIFKTFDAEKDPIDQGYSQGSYDLVVAFFIIHATSDLERALRNIRRLLRPGGFLVVGEGQEGQNGVASSGFIFGTLPGWWLGAGKNEGRDLSPHVSPEAWNTLLKKTGFSGVDAKVPGSFEDILNVYHFVSQAVDDQTNFFRQPLLSSSWNIPPVNKLVVVGGHTSRSAHFAQGVRDVFENRRLATKVYSFDTLLDVDFSLVDADATVVSLCELDQPVFKGITPEVFAALRRMFEDGKTLLWITSGRLRDEPYSNMTVGFGRTAAHESSDLCLQQLDVTDPQSLTSEDIAEVLMRLYASKYLDGSLLWTTEPEIIIDNDGRHLLSRLRPIPELNDRYNSAHRTIVHERDVGSSPFVLEQPVRGKSVVKHLSRWGLLADNRAEDSVELRTTHAISLALKTPLGYKFLILGLGSDDAPYLALASSLGSLTMLPTKSAVPCHIPGVSPEDILLAMASHLIAFNVLNPLYSGQVVIAHNPTASVAQALDMQAAAKGIRVVFTADHTDQEDIPSWILLPPYTTKLDIQEILPSQPSSFVGFSRGDQLYRNEAAIISCLPQACHIETAATLYSTAGTTSHCSTAPFLADILERMLDFTRETIKNTGSGQLAASSRSLSSLLNGEQPADPMAVIDFTIDKMLPVHASRLDTWPVFKGKGSTYWISGMTGALGISLCDWMINRGARNIVLTSRKPDIATAWVNAHRRRGAMVTIIPCDVTDEKQVRAVHERICQEFPPIAGVMHGAMVLRDVSIRNMTFEQLTDVLRPKVDGSIILDRVFYDTNLDFFILISSINCVIGNWGQANYAAANTFMCGLAEQRRRRGLRAATVNAGAIIGAGYMERESRRALDTIVQKLYMMKLSEEDWHQAILEAIDASRLDSPHGPEITTGLSDVPFEISNAPTWYTNPKFSDFIVHSSIEKNDNGSGKAPVSIQELLQGCQSREQALEVVERGFAAQLRNTLQMDMTNEELMASRSTDIGLDSLVSVDIRSWFLKNLQASIPVLKIMGNSTMAELVEVAVEAMPQELIPNASVNEAESEDTSTGSPDKMDSPPTEMASSARTSPARTPPHAEEKTATTTTTMVTSHGNVDWVSESTPPADFANIPRVPDRPLASPPKVIVLTGVSGLLGHHLLEHILTTTSATTVHCLAVRRLGARLRNGELPSDPRVVYHDGQLADPLLGLSQTEAATIFDEADCVVHNGADTSHVKFYSDLKASNVGSTVALARLCLPRRVPLHYVSSAGVAVYYGRDSFPEVSVTGPGSSYPASDGSFGYGCSKWTNERLLEQVHGLYGLPVAIYRPSTIIRAGPDAEGPKAELDWVNALLHYIRKIGAAPRTAHNRGALDLVSTRSCCDEIISHVTKKRGGAEEEEETLRYFNLVGDSVIPLDLLCEIDSAGRGETYELLPLAEWISRATAAGLHPAVAVLIEEMDSPGCTEYPRLEKAKRETLFSP